MIFSKIKHIVILIFEPMNNGKKFIWLVKQYIDLVILVTKRINNDESKGYDF